MIYIHAIVTCPTFLAFDTLWNTPLGKFYNGTSVRLRTHVIVRITIWSFLASLLGTKLSIDVKKYQHLLDAQISRNDFNQLG
jgi:hypothetical protein